MKKSKVLVLALAAAFLGFSINSLADEIESRKLSILKITGNEASIAKGNNVKFRATEGINLGRGNKVGAGINTNIYIEADNDKTIKLDENTQVEVTKASAKALGLKLLQGDLFFNVENPLEEDEEMVFEAANTSMSIRGTSGIFSFSPYELTFYLVEGDVSWDLGDGQSVELSAGSKIQLVPEENGVKLGPGTGADTIYVLKEVLPFTWRDLTGDGLAAVLEFRDKIDLSILGIDTEEELAEAMDLAEKHKDEDARTGIKAEEKKKSRSGGKSGGSGYRNSDDDEDDSSEEPASPPEAEETDPSVEFIEGTTGDYLYQKSGSSVKKVKVYYEDDSETYGSWNTDETDFIWDLDYIQSNKYYFTREGAEWALIAEGDADSGEWLTYTDMEEGSENSQTFDVWVEYINGTNGSMRYNDTYSANVWTWDMSYLEKNNLEADSSETILGATP